MSNIGSTKPPKQPTGYPCERGEHCDYLRTDGGKPYCSFPCVKERGWHADIQGTNKTRVQGINGAR